MFFRVTLDPPVIFVAITSFSRGDLSFLSQLPMMRSVSPSGWARSEGMGYCSAVSIMLTPALENRAVHHGVTQRLV